MKKKVILTSDLNDELAQAKLATQAVADKYIELCDLAQSGFFTLSEDGEILELNLYGSQLLGKERQGLKHSLFGFFVSDDTKPIFNMFLRNVFTCGTKQSCEVTLSINSNAPVYVHLIGNTIESGKQCIVNVVDVTEQKKTEESLNANNLFLQTLLDAIPVPVFYKDGDGRYTGVNKSFETFFGQTSKELIGKTVFDIASAEFAEIYHKQDMEILQYPAVQVYDSQVKDGNGILHDVVFHKASFIGSSGHQGLIGVILDITDRKKAEKALRESEEKFKSIYEGSNDAIMLLNEKGFLDCNTKTLELFGLKTKEDFIDLHPSELSPSFQPDGRNSFESANEKIYTAYQQGLNRFDWIHRRFNGEIFPAEVILSDFNLGGKHVIQSTVRDITGRKLTEETLRESEAKLNAILQSTADGILAIGNNGKVIKANERFKKLWNIPQSLLDSENDTALLNFVLYQLIDPEQFISKVKMLYNSVDEDLDILHFKDGRIFERFSEPIIMSNSLIGRVWSFRDITERKQAEEELNLIRLKLELALQSSMMGVWQYNIIENKRHFDNQVCSLFGIDPEKFSGSAEEFFAVVHPDDREIVKEALKKTIELNVPYELEYRVLWSDGSVHFITSRGKLIIDDKGTPQSISGIAWDITDRKKAEKALINERSLFRTIIDLIPDALFVKDSEGRKILANPKEVQFSGKNSEIEVISKTDYDLLPDIEAKRAMAEDQLVLQTGKSILEIEGTLIDREGKLHYLLGAKVAMRDLQGKITGIVGLTRDITERKLAEDALKESEALYRNLVLKMPDGVYKSTHDGKFIDVNPALIKMLGYDSKEELIAIDIKAQLYFESADRESLVLQEKLEEMGIYRLKKKDGSEIWVEDHGWYNLDEKGEILSHEGIMRDVTDRKHAEDLLQLSEERYRTIIDNIGEGIGFVNAEERFELANMAAEKIFGAEPGGLVGMNLDQFVSPEQYYFLQKETELRSQGKKSVYELEITRPNGEKRTILVTAVAKIDKDSGFIGTYGLFRDITDRKLAEEELAHQQYLMQTLMDNLPDHIYFKDLESRFVRISKSHALLFGLNDPDLAIGKSDRDFFSGEHSGQAYEDEQTIIRTGKPLSIVEKETFHDQPDRWVSTIKMPFLDKDEKIIGTFGISRDVTEHKFAEEIIKLKNEELQKANAEKDKFFSIIAHDLRSPFNSFLGYTEMMVDELDNMSLKEIQFMAGELKKSANNLYNLLENLLEWSRIERGITGFEPKAFLLKTKITESIQSVLESSNKKEIEISLNIPEDLEVFADENMLKSTIRNLTTNAVKFTPKGGNIAISSRSPDDNFVEISIKDNGIGMKKEMLDKLFKLTEQTSRPGTEGEPSSGLGLILCKDFVEKHGGKIWVESEEGKGSEFIFTIPMKVN